MLPFREIEIYVRIAFRLFPESFPRFGGVRFPLHEAPTIATHVFDKHQRVNFLHGVMVAAVEPLRYDNRASEILFQRVNAR